MSQAPDSGASAANGSPEGSAAEARANGPANGPPDDLPPSADGPSSADTTASDVPPTVRAHGLVKTHHGEGAPARAVRGVDLTVRAGEFVAITGPSGAGKSTLLHLLGGLQRPDEGGIWLDGERVDAYSERRWAVLRRRRIGIVFQFFNLVSNLTVADNVELPALLAGTTPRKARQERAELLAELGLEGRERSMPGELSGGEQQRVALARALVNHPTLLLADEPAGSLDSKGTREVTRLLSRFHQRGQTILLVTHDARLASTADRVVSFFDGRVVDDAPLGGSGRRGGERRPSGGATGAHPAPDRASGSGVSGLLELRDD